MQTQIPNIKMDCLNDDIKETIMYIHNHWQELIKKSPVVSNGELLRLPHPYVVPGGRFQELFYWDSYFTMLGLRYSGLNELSKGIVDNFLYEMESYGIIANSSRIAHLSRSQPPFLTSMILEVWDDDKEWLARAFSIAKAEYHNVWMNPSTHFNEETGLNLFFDDIEKMLRVRGETYLHFDEVVIPDHFKHARAECESGWDYSNRFNQECGDYIPVDLNALLYKYEIDFAIIADLLGQLDEKEQWNRQAEKRKALIDHYLWNEDQGVYLDYHIPSGEHRHYLSLATFYPLWSGVSSANQAKRVKENIHHFLYKGGMVTSTEQSGFQWDYPNGWAPLQWLVIKGLSNYGYHEESRQIAERWVNLCTDMFKKHGKLYEKYNVVEGNLKTPERYPVQEGFGWTNGVYVKLAVDYLGCKIEL